MAPPRVVAGTAGGGFTAIPVRFSARSRASRHLFVKPHRVREAADRRRPQDRTLFVLNLPPYITQECAHRLFSQCGPVTSVELQEKPGTGSKSEKQKSKFFSGPSAQNFRVAYVVFKKPAGVKAAVSSKRREPWVLSPSDHPIKTGLQNIAQLRKKFEEDKQRIALLRAERKFKPY
ncbi:hypothetical protein scyTo_0017503 [Scyliorhinus torazame]|uniref:RRM domain-containing protein n=1 Tax=Scyliorhinus torazame TaxID=75743 RepID=A0A401PUE9_SCYTO|nr:hypothetical protein [Scyliorhinus torazame]